MISLGPQPQKLIDAKTAASGTGTSVPIRTHGRDELVFYFQSAGTTSGGTLVIEEAIWDPNVDPVYSGTWSQIGSTINASSFTGTAQLAIHVSPNAYGFVRVRIATDITGGGTVTVWGKSQ